MLDPELKRLLQEIKVAAQDKGHFVIILMLLYLILRGY